MRATGIIGAMLAFVVSCALIAGPPLAGDLVVIDASQLDSLADSRLPVIWKGAGFVLARWDAGRQAMAASGGIGFDRLRRLSDPAFEIYLFELPARRQPPPEWQERLLFRDGRKWLLEASPDSARSWIAAGHRGLLIPGRERGWPEAPREASYTCGYSPLTDGLLGDVSTSRWFDWIEKLSGAESFIVNDAEHLIATRYSSRLFSGDPTARAFDFVLEQVQSWNYPPSAIEVDPYGGLGGETWNNLVLTLPGQTHPEEVVLLTAHLDSVTSVSTAIAPGANDNGTGAATLLEAARLLRQLRFERTIQLVWFTGEEDGLLGSRAFCDDHPVSGFVGALNLDMFGWDGDGDRCFEIHAGTLPASQAVGDCFANSVDAYALGLSRDYLTSGATDRSDHASFWQVGVGAIEIAENFFNDGLPGGCTGSDANPAYHTSGDTVANVAPSFASDIARSAIATIVAMAGPIEACFDETPAVSATPGVSSVALEWTPVEGAASYTVRRSVTGCDGQWFARGVTPQTSWLDEEADLPLTYHYQVEAIDADGRCVSSVSECVAATPTVFHASQAGWTPIDVCASGGPGSGDGVIDPGESVLLPVELINDGNSAISAVAGMLLPATAGVEAIDPHGEWPDLAPGAGAESLPNHLGLSFGGSLSCGEVVEASLDLTYAEGTNIAGLTFPIGAVEESLLLDEEFSGEIPPGWTIVDGGSGGGAAATWTTANPGGRTIGPPFVGSFAIIDSDAAGSSASQNESLIGPLLDGAGCGRLLLEFSNQFNWYNGGLDELAEVDVSTNGGADWVNLLRLEGGDDGSPEANTKTVDFTAAVSGNPSAFELRFHYSQAQYEWWWAIDNVRVRCSTDVCTPCQADLSAPGEPGELRLDRDSLDLRLQWSEPPLTCGAQGYSVYRGALDTLRGGSYDHDTPLACQTPSTSLELALDDPAIGTADYYLVVGDNGLHEGSYGRTAAGDERPAAAICRAAQNILACVPPPDPTVEGMSPFSPWDSKIDK